MTNQAIDSEALDWVVRLGDAAFDDWSAFQAWLEADPANASRYHALSADVDEMVGHAAKVNLPGVLSRPVGARKVGYLIGGALAASIAMLFVYATLLPPAKSYTVETAAGEMRSLDLADGSRITLSGKTRISFDGSNPRMATLDQGQALFDVRHDPNAPFSVTVGGRKVVDVGTVFDIKRMQDQTRVAVAAGAVDYDADGAPVRLIAGQGLIARDGATAASARIAATSVGAWRSGTLAYDGAPIAEVAADLSRSVGIDVKADRSVAARRFYGSIVVADVKRDPLQMAAVLDLRVQRSGAFWILMSD